jgi:hypothetical protein
MSDFQAYRDRVNAMGNSIQESVINNSKQLTTEQMLNSPSLKYVKLNDGIESLPCIVSDEDSFNKREFLFVPDSIINVGDYIHHDTFTYLATDRNRDDIYPELTGELCNETYKIITGQTKQTVGTDDFGRPIYDYIDEVDNVPCVMTTKIYSTIDNSAIPLPDGSMMIKLPYLVGTLPKVNDEFIHHESHYKVTTISYENVIADVGYVEIRLQTGVSA